MARRTTPDRRRRHIARQAAEWDDLATLEAAQRSALAGLAPAEPSRLPFPHERRARTDFAALDARVRAVARELLEGLEDDRAAFLELLGDDLAGRAPAEVVDRLLDIDGPLGLADVAGVEELIEEAQRRNLDLLGIGWEAGAQAVEGEARAQGIDPAALSGIPDRAVGGRQLEQLARRLASGPLVDLVRILREAAVNAPTVG